MKRYHPTHTKQDTNNEFDPEYISNEDIDRQRQSQRTHGNPEEFPNKDRDKNGQRKEQEQRQQKNKDKDNQKAPVKTGPEDISKL